MRPPATPSASLRTSTLPMRKRASWAVSTGRSARSGTRARDRSRDSLHPLDQMRARRSWLERVAKVLGLAGDLAIQELHDAHRIGRPAVVREDEFRDPEVAGADDSAHRKAFEVRLHGARGLDVVPAPDALTRLRILKHGVLSVYVVLYIEVIRVRSGPMAIELLSDLILIHAATPDSGPHFWSPFLVIEA